jgi:hypothetical protein
MSQNSPCESLRKREGPLTLVWIYVDPATEANPLMAER